MNPLSFSINLTPHRRAKDSGLGVGEEEHLSEGASFWDVETDLYPIYHNFNILSYFSPSVGIKLYDVKQAQYGDKLIKIYEFSYGANKNIFYLC